LTIIYYYMNNYCYHFYYEADNLLKMTQKK